MPNPTEAEARAPLRDLDVSWWPLIEDYAEAVRATERAKWQAAMVLCDEHQPRGGVRAKCVVCSGIALTRVISRIDYVLGPANEMELSMYDVAPVEEDVLERVVAQRAREKRLRDALTGAQAQLEALHIAIGAALSEQEAPSA